MEWYDSFWDAVRVEKTLVNSAIRKGLAQGLEQGLQQGIEKGREEGVITVARNMKSIGISVEDIMKVTGLAADVIEGL